MGESGKRSGPALAGSVTSSYLAFRGMGLEWVKWRSDPTGCWSRRPKGRGVRALSFGVPE